MMNGCLNDGESPMLDDGAFLSATSSTTLSNNNNHSSLQCRPKFKQLQKQQQFLDPSGNQSPPMISCNVDVAATDSLAGFNEKTGLEAKTPSIASSMAENGLPARRADDSLNSNGASAKRTHKERRFHRLFRSVPLNEILLNRFSCAFVSDIGLLLQGHMYVSYDWICFHSNIFGIEKIIEIPVNSILTASKSKTAKIIPNAVCIRTKDGRQYAFSSLISRDTTHGLLSTVLNRCHLSASSLSTEHDFTDTTPNNKSLNSDQALVTTTPTIGASGAPGLAAQNENFVPTFQSLNENLSSSSAESSDDDDDDDVSLETDILKRKIIKIKQRATLTSDHNADLAPKRTSVSVDHRNAFARMRCSFKMSFLSFFNWFASLPKVLMILFVCVFMLALLFCLAIIMTYRLLHLRSPNTSLFNLLASSNFGEKRVIFWEHDTFDRIDGLIEHSLKLVEDLKKQLDALKQELHNEASNHQHTFAH